MWGPKNNVPSVGYLAKNKVPIVGFFFFLGGGGGRPNGGMGGGCPSGSTFGGRGALVVFLIFSDVKPGQSD